MLCLMHALEIELPLGGWQFWLVCTAYVSVSYVAGFLTLPAPGGLGVREVIMQQLLLQELTAKVDADSAASQAVVVALSLRLIWTVSELILAGGSWLVSRLATPRLSKVAA
jgi:uncharacterized membrane protein YbhN (UPF0104 family)